MNIKYRQRYLSVVVRFVWNTVRLLSLRLAPHRNALRKRFRLSLERTLCVASQSIDTHRSDITPFLLGPGRQQHWWNSACASPPRMEHTRTDSPLPCNKRRTGTQNRKQRACRLVAFRADQNTAGARLATSCSAPVFLNNDASARIRLRCQRTTMNRTNSGWWRLTL